MTCFQPIIALFRTRLPCRHKKTGGRRLSLLPPTL